ncbi:MAG TPA: amino acid ABC transporter substrate-binding protein [Acetobacteraceae bacterium]|jgi:general L-amino acid transport system substrate-binding protein|nr:amino acid ABC transporter substrate-binding protein [Acetobacteraceae bacterium]
MKKLLLAACAAVAVLAAQPKANAATLEDVRARGILVCGVNTALAGFSAPDSQGVWRGLDVDYCRAIAAAVLGDPAKVRFSPLTAALRFTALQSGEIDVLLRNSTETYLRDTSIGLTAGPVNFYDGQGFAVRKESGVKSVSDLNGATICMAQGTTHEQNATEWFAAHGLKFQPVIMENQETMYQAFFSGRCDALSQDSSALAVAIGVVSGKPDDFVVLPERISKEPLGPFVRHGDETWAKIVRWTLSVMIEAEELGVTQAKVDELAQSGSAAQKRLTGAGDDMGKPLGLDPKWSANVLRAVGNYGESFERNVGQASSMKLQRGLNGLWTNGGLMYAIPFR